MNWTHVVAKTQLTKLEQQKSDKRQSGPSIEGLSSAWQLWPTTDACLAVSYRARSCGIMILKECSKRKATAARHRLSCATSIKSIGELRLSSA
eukprot:5980209-Amphidinium_carterae.1